MISGLSARVSRLDLVASILDFDFLDLALAAGEDGGEEAVIIVAGVERDDDGGNGGNGLVGGLPIGLGR